MFLALFNVVDYDTWTHMNVYFKFLEVKSDKTAKWELIITDSNCYMLCMSVECLSDLQYRGVSIAHRRKLCAVNEHIQVLYFSQDKMVEAFLLIYCPKGLFFIPTFSPARRPLAERRFCVQNLCLNT